ncbi:MAG: 1-deoxy-D-xylulose-5-phosphate reductoisomerase [Peptostreptococcaceae bacterium]|nr:1-deoxy-D-xylulose-5-phosphate reductoisomerase [Peptostreptococcaceae bacterium]
MKQLAILGSTGSIGTQTLDVVSKYPEEFTVKILTCNRNIDLLAKQINEYRPEYAVVCDRTAYECITKENFNVKILYGYKGIIAALDNTGVDVVVNALVGISGMLPTRHAIELGANIALANKETLVTAGELIMADAKAKGVKILPIDSEHNAISQCLNGENKDRLKHIILTASGGPFRGKSYNEMERVTIKEALAHPNWTMGKKITIDSATMMNKGFEVLEAKWLFDVDIDMIKVIVHPQSVVHSMVEFIDGSVIAQMSMPNMKLPIGYVLFEGKRMPLELKSLCLSEIGTLTFEKPDKKAFPCLGYAYYAGNLGGTCPAALNAANEVLVDAFLKGKIRFLEIQNIIEEVLESHNLIKHPEYESIVETDYLTRKFVVDKLRNR